MGYRIVSISYLGLTRERAAAGQHEPGWQSFYRYFPWEDWREGPPKILARAVLPRLKGWVEAVSDGARRERRQRVDGNFDLRPWNEELVLQRYELLYEAGLVPEAGRPRKPVGRSRAGRADALRPSPHPRHRHRPAARQDQIPAGRVRADAARLHPGPAPARGRGAGRAAAAQAELPPPGRAAGPGRGDRCGDRPAPAGGRPSSTVSAARSCSNAPSPAPSCHSPAPRAPVLELRTCSR